MELIIKLGAITPLISGLYMIFAGIVKYINNNPESKLKIFGQSIIQVLLLMLLLMLLQ